MRPDQRTSRLKRERNRSRSRLRASCSCRYQRGSDVCEKLAKSLEHLTGSEERELFDFGRRSGDSAPLMLLLDRWNTVVHCCGNSARLRLLSELCGARTWSQFQQSNNVSCQSVFVLSAKADISLHGLEALRS